jgi:hypothetical protein
LSGIRKPFGVSGFRLMDALPAELKSNLPTVKEFENERNKNRE